MKIVIASDIAPRRISSFERFIFGCVDSLEGMGWEVRCLFSGPLADHVKAKFGVRDETIFDDLGRPDNRSRRAIWFDRIRAERPDVIWNHFLPIVGPYALGQRRAAPKAVICQTDHISRGPLRRGFLKAILHRVRAAICDHCIDHHAAVSQFIANRLITSDGVPARKVQVDFNGVDLDVYQPSSPRGPYLVQVCYMRPEKGVDVLLEALARLKREGMEPQCQIIGDGPCLGQYRAAGAGFRARQGRIPGPSRRRPGIVARRRSPWSLRSGRRRGATPPSRPMPPAPRWSRPGSVPSARSSRMGSRACSSPRETRRRSPRRSPA